MNSDVNQFDENQDDEDLYTFLDTGTNLTDQERDNLENEVKYHYFNVATDDDDLLSNSNSFGYLYQYFGTNEFEMNTGMEENTSLGINEGQIEPNYSTANDSNANASNLDNLGSNMQQQYDNEASDSNEIANAFYDETALPCKNKRRNEDEDEERICKRHRSCAKILSEFKSDVKIKDNKNVAISEEDIEKYLKLKSKEEECNHCKKRKSIMEVFSIDGIYVCKSCADEERISLDYLKYNLYEHLSENVGYEEFDFHNEPLFKCDRLDHAAPLYCYIKEYKKNQSNKDDKSYRILTNCPHCRNYKAQENSLKKKQKELINAFSEA